MYCNGRGCVGRKVVEPSAARENNEQDVGLLAQVMPAVSHSSRMKVIDMVMILLVGRPLKRASREVRWPSQKVRGVVM
eukprot:scaffold872_cov119-Skeletonema_dohrnii-CCMP3373.AAC.12